MKTRTRLLCISMTLLSVMMVTRFASGQLVGDGPFQAPGVQPFMTDLNVGWPGRVWLEANAADQGLGYQGSYLTAGVKSHLFQDYLDGRWLFEGQGHVSAESGGFFANFGIERVFSLEAAGADLSLGGWVDYDDDQQGGFAHTFTQVAVSGSIKTRRWDMLGNAYFPIGTTDYRAGDPANGDCFLNNSIVIQAGIDSALEGFDALLQFRPEGLALVNGTVGLGGYGYGSEQVEYFGGVRARAGMQLFGGLITNVELNYDNRYDFTGVLQLALMFGGSARGTEYGLLGRDLEPTVRNDHIVRFQQDLVLAMDPDTGRAYNVFHVDNLADASVEDGTAERPFTRLKLAEGASSADDIIFVHEGNGTIFGMDEGIVLKDGQLLLGDGVQHVIPIQNGLGFVLCNDIDGNRPTITNRFGGNAVDLANRNTVRGIIIDGSTGFMISGISGDGSGGPSLFSGIIEDVTITGSPILNGIMLDNISGDWRFARNNVQTASGDGIFIDNAVDSTSLFTFNNNVVSNNGGRGIHIEDYDGSMFTFRSNNTNGNIGDGIRMERFTGTRASYEFVANTSSNNNGSGVSLIDGAGDLRFINSTITGNTANGIRLVDFTNPLAADETFIGTGAGGVSSITGNGVGAGSGISIEQNTGTQSVRIVNNEINNNGSGIFASSDGALTALTLDITNNRVNGSQADGMRFQARGGSFQDVTIANVDMTGGTAANGIAFFSGDSNLGVSSLLRGDISNTQITTTGGSGILADVQLDGQLELNVTNVDIVGAAADAVTLSGDTNDNNLVSRVVLDDVQATGVGVNGVQLVTGIDTYFDLQVINSSFAGGTGDGVSLTATGDDTDAAIDNRTRFFAVNSQFTGFGGNGIQLTGAGDAHVFAEMNGVSTTGNTANGIDLATSDDAIFNVRVLNSQVTGNGASGFDANTADTSTMNMSLIGNNISGNTTNDMTVTNALASTMCLSMSNNFFVLPALVTNNAAAASFRLELDGLTNGIGNPTITTGAASVTLTPFGSVCEPAIAAEELAFEAAGFPPLP